MSMSILHLSCTYPAQKREEPPISKFPQPSLWEEYRFSEVLGKFSRSEWEHAFLGRACQTRLPDDRLSAEFFQFARLPWSYNARSGRSWSLSLAWYLSFLQDTIQKMINRSPELLSSAQHCTNHPSSSTLTLSQEQRHYGSIRELKATKPFHLTIILATICSIVQREEGNSDTTQILISSISSDQCACNVFNAMGSIFGRWMW